MLNQSSVEKVSHATNDKVGEVDDQRVVLVDLFASVVKLGVVVELVCKLADVRQWRHEVVGNHRVYHFHQFYFVAFLLQLLNLGHVVQQQHLALLVVEVKDLLADAVVSYTGFINIVVCPINELVVSYFLIDYSSLLPYENVVANELS